MRALNGVGRDDAGIPSDLKALVTGHADRRPELGDGGVGGGVLQADVRA